jgi:chromosome partitioning protein
MLNAPELLSYEYIIIDCPPTLKGLTSIAMTTADTILIPIKSGQFSIHALKKMIEYFFGIKKFHNSQLQIEGILRTMYEPDTNAWTLTNEALEKNYKNYLLDTVIPKNTTLTESEFHHKPAVLYNLKARGPQAYLELAKEILMHNSLH